MGMVPPARTSNVQQQQYNDASSHLTDEEKYLYYLYTTRTHAIENELRLRGYTLNSLPEAIWAMQQELHANDSFEDFLLRLDPAHENHNRLAMSNVTGAQVARIQEQSHVKELVSRSTDERVFCSKDDMLCIMRDSVRDLKDSFAVKLTTNHIILIAAVGIGLVLWITRKQA